MEWTVEEEENLLSSLGKKYPDSSKATLKKMVAEGRVVVDNGVATSPLHPLMKGQKVKVLAKKSFLEGDVKLLYSDKDIAVVDKPYGLLTVATDFQAEKTMHALLKRHFPNARVFPVHRLDQDTSGLLVFALNEVARDFLKEEFEKRRPKRRYLAVVEGGPDPSEGVWRSYLREDANYVVRNTSDQTEGKLAITHYKTVKKGRSFSLLELKLETGRKNQIRVHCQMAGVPVVGDKKYGSTKNPFYRLMLHAFELTLNHPKTGKSMKFESAVPEEFYSI